MNNSYTWLTQEDGDGSSELSKGGSSDNFRDVYAVGWVTDEAMVYGARDKGVEFDGDSEVFEEYDATGDGDYGV